MATPEKTKVCDVMAATCPSQTSCPPTVVELRRARKAALDPAGILNSGRIFE